MEPEQGRTSTKYQIFSYNRMAVEFNQRATDYQVLFNLGKLLPWCIGTPFRDVIKRNHSSGVTVSFGSSLHRDTMMWL